MEQSYPLAWQYKDFALRPEQKSPYIIKTTPARHKQWRRLADFCRAHLPWQTWGSRDDSKRGGNLPMLDDVDVIPPADGKMQQPAYWR